MEQSFKCIPTKKTSAQQFTVYRIDDKCPTYATLTTEKNTYDIGETINFTSKSDYSTGIWLSVLNQNGTVINLSLIHI